MGKYLDILDRVGRYDRNDINDQTHTGACITNNGCNQQSTFGRISRFGRSLSELERRCPDRIEPDDWRLAVEDGRRFLARWGDQAEALGWTVRDLFGLATVPDMPASTYRRLSRYDQTGLVWLLRGRSMLALTETTAAVQSPTGAVTVYRRHQKPALGPLGDTLDDFA